MGEPEEEKEQTCFCCPHLWNLKMDSLSLLFVMIRLLPLLRHIPPSPVSKLVWRHIGRLRKRDNLLADGEGGWGRS